MTTATSSSSFDTTLNSLGIGRTASTAPVASAAGSQTLGQADFLKLMTAQMQNQDPFNPVDNTQMIAQMAQFSSVAGISQMNTTLSAIATKLGATSVSDATSYIGKTVLTAGNVAYPRTSGGLAGAVDLGGDATDVQVQIQDANGAVLKTMDLGAQSQGTVSFDWDGSTDSGAAAGDGPFQIAVAAANAGASVTAQPLVWAPVTSVAMPASGSPVLTVAGLGTVPVSAVRQIG